MTSSSSEVGSGVGDSKVKPIPEGFHSVTPAITVEGATEALEFYRRAFGAEIVRSFTAGGKVMHAEMRIGDSIVMVSDALPEYGFRSPKDFGGTHGALMIYCADVDALFKRAIDAGGTQVSAVNDQFSGNRYGVLNCPYGHRWLIGTQKKIVSDAEVQRITEEWAKMAPKAGG